MIKEPHAQPLLTKTFLKFFLNLKLSDKIGVGGNIVDNPVTELPTESAVNAKLKELQDAWDAKHGG